MVKIPVVTDVELTKTLFGKHVAVHSYPHGGLHREETVEPVGTQLPGAKDMSIITYTLSQSIVFSLFVAIVSSLTLNAADSPAPPPLKAPFTKAEAMDSQRAWAKHLGTEVKFKNSLRLKNRSVSMNFQLIPPGEFMMGSDMSASAIAQLYDAKAEKFEDEHPQHRVELTKPFWLQTTEVTQGQWEAVMGTTPWGEEGGYLKVDHNYPATGISWNEATEFCRKLSKREGRTYRLPTEAEWEYACRAGTTTRFPGGRPLYDYAWYYKVRDKKENYPHPVGRKRANNFGLYDMLGNVSEWCADLYDKDFYAKSPVKDPTGPTQVEPESRVLRGGSWVRYRWTGVRSASRDWSYPDYNNADGGFRVVVE